MHIHKLPRVFCVWENPREYACICFLFRCIFRGLVRSEILLFRIRTEKIFFLKRGCVSPQRLRFKRSILLENLIGPSYLELRSSPHSQGSDPHTNKLYTFIPNLLLRLLCFFRRTAALFRQIRTFPQLFWILLRFGESWNTTNCEKFNADGSQMGRTNLDQSVW